jgi:hypothetical protein
LIDETVYFDDNRGYQRNNTAVYNNSFEIDFVALDYSYPENNQYAYILEGFDESWRYCSANESFTNILISQAENTLLKL